MCCKTKLTAHVIEKHKQGSIKNFIIFVKSFHFLITVCLDQIVGH